MITREVVVRAVAVAVGHTVVWHVVRYSVGCTVWHAVERTIDRVVGDSVRGVVRTTQDVTHNPYWRE